MQKGRKSLLLNSCNIFWILSFQEEEEEEEDRLLQEKDFVRGVGVGVGVSSSI